MNRRARRETHFSASSKLDRTESMSFLIWSTCRSKSPGWARGFFASWRARGKAGSGSGVSGRAEGRAAHRGHRPGIAACGARQERWARGRGRTADLSAASAAAFAIFPVDALPDMFRAAGAGQAPGPPASCTPGRRERPCRPGAAQRRRPGECAAAGRCDAERGVRPWCAPAGPAPPAAPAGGRAQISGNAKNGRLHSAARVRAAVGRHVQFCPWTGTSVVRPGWRGGVPPAAPPEPCRGRGAASDAASPGGAGCVKKFAISLEGAAGASRAGGGECATRRSRTTVSAVSYEM